MKSVEQRFAESKAVILDVDCVLVHSFMSVITQSMQLVQITRGQHIHPDRIMKIQSNYVKTDDIIEQLIHPSEDEWPRVRRLHTLLFQQNSYMPPIGDPAQFARNVRESTRKVAIWTSRPPEFLTHTSCPSFIFDDDDPYRLFDAVSTHQGGDTDKPHPDSLRRLAKELEVPETEYDKIVVVEDMPQNVQAAQQLGMLTVGVLSGLAGVEISRTRMEKVAPDLIVPTYEDVRPYLGLPTEL
ncbi:MAG TPA: HAD-IA family hydrolase [Candidatus Saccharimonadales bacterium]|nr:HAD-IA family hydrolase [Candidatus Saccharimonadales bacterium]